MTMEFQSLNRVCGNEIIEYEIGMFQKTMVIRSINHFREIKLVVRIVELLTPKTSLPSQGCWLFRRVNEISWRLIYLSNLSVIQKIFQGQHKN